MSSAPRLAIVLRRSVSAIADGRHEQTLMSAFVFCWAAARVALSCNPKSPMHGGAALPNGGPS